MMLITSVSLLLLCCLCHSVAPLNIQYTPVRVAVVVDSVTYPKLVQAVPGWWKEHVQLQGGISGVVPVILNEIYSVGAASTGWATNITKELIANGTDAVLIMCLDTIIPPAATLLETAGIPLIVPAAPSPSLFRCSLATCVIANTRRFQVAHGIMASAENYMEPFVSLLKIRGGRSVAFLSPSSSASAPGVVVPVIYSEWQVSTQSISINNNIQMYTIPVRFPAPTASEIVSITSKLQELQVDAIIGLLACELYLPYWKSINFNVKAMSFIRCIDAFFPPATDPRDMMQFLTAPTQWDYRLAGSEYSEYTNAVVSWFPTPDINSQATTSASSSSPLVSASAIKSAQQFQLLSLNRTGTAPDYATAAFAASFEFLGAGISNWLSQRLATLVPSSNSSTNLTLTIDHGMLNRQLQLVYEPSFFGLLSTNRYGYNQQKQIPYLQRSTDNQNEIISPVAAATKDFIYPMPTWTERVYVHAMYATTEEIAVYALVIICIAYTIGLCVALCYHRQSRQVRASSLSFSLVMAFGSIAGYLSVLTWPIENNSTTCASRPWIWGLAFQLFFAPLLAKSYRIARIFHVQKFQKTKHDDRLVLRHTLYIAFPQLLILLIWSVVSPLQVVIRIPDVLRPVNNYADCDSSGAATYVWLSVAYASICLLAGCILAFRVRVSYELFNDARYIANAVYIFTLTALIIAAVQASSEQAQHKSIFIIRSIGALVAYCSCCSLLLLPRVLGVIRTNTSGEYNHATKLDGTKASSLGLQQLPDDNHSTDGGAGRSSAINIKVQTSTPIHGRKSSFPSLPENHSSDTEHSTDSQTTLISTRQAQSVYSRPTAPAPAPAASTRSAAPTFAQAFVRRCSSRASQSTSATAAATAVASPAPNVKPTLKQAFGSVN